VRIACVEEIAYCMGYIDAGQLDQLLHPTLDPNAEKTVLAKGLPASPGAASGELVFDADEAVHLKAQGHTVILARVETSPEDVQGMHAAVGILTTRGGMTSHAAVVARGMGRPCVVGASAVVIDLERETLSAGGTVLHKGDVVTIEETRPLSKTKTWRVSKLVEKAHEV